MNWQMNKRGVFKNCGLVDKEDIWRPSPPSLSKWPHQSLVPPHQQRCQRCQKIHHTAHRDRCALILTTLLSPSFFKWFLFLCDTTSMQHEIQTFSYLRSKLGETPHSVRLAHPSIPNPCMSAQSYAHVWILLGYWHPTCDTCPPQLHQVSPHMGWRPWHATYHTWAN